MHRVRGTSQGFVQTQCDSKMRGRARGDLLQLRDAGPQLSRPPAGGAKLLLSGVTAALGRTEGFLRLRKSSRVSGL